jgi:hypothetical protein
MGAFDQGFAFGAGFPLRAAQHQQAYSDEEHETLLKGFNDSAANIQQRIAQVGTGSPEYAGLQSQLNQVIADRTALFHPNRPGGLERLGKMLWTKVHGESTPETAAPRIAEVPVAGTQGTTLPGMNGGMNITSPTLPATSVAVDTLPNTPVAPPRNAAEAKTRFAQDLAAGAPHSNQFQQMHQSLVEAGFSPEDAEKAVRVTAGLAPKPMMYRPFTPHYQNYKLADGTFKMFNLNDPYNQPPDGAMPVSTGAAMPHVSTAALETYIRSQFPDGATPEQREWAIRRFNSLTHPDTNSSHESIQYDSDGNAHIVTLATSSKKDFGAVNGPPPPSNSGIRPPVSNGPAGAQSAAAPTAAPTGPTTLTGQPVTVAQPAPATPPKTAGEARKRAASVKSSAAATGAPAAPAVDARVASIHKNTPAQSAADKKVGDFTALSKQADLAEKAPDDAVKQRSLVLALIRASAGRVNMQEYDSYVKRQGLANNLEQWANNMQSGALPADIFRKIIGVTRDYLSGAKAEQQEAYKGTNVAGKNGSGAEQGGEDTSAPPAEVVAKAAEGQFMHGPGGTYKKVNGKAVKQ